MDSVERLRFTTQSNASHSTSGGCSSVGRAPDCDSGGRGFKPHQPPHLFCWFALEELYVGNWRSLVAHLVWVQGVAGSNPALPTILSPLSLVSPFKFNQHPGFFITTVYHSLFCVRLST